MPMQQRFWMIVFFLLSAVTGGVWISAQEQPSDTVYGLINSNRVIARRGPDFAYPIAEQLAIDTSVEILGRAGSFFGRYDGRQWIHVRYGDKDAWVLARFVRMGRSFNSIPLTGLSLPRDGDRRVPPEFDISSNICASWSGNFAQSGNFMAGDAAMTFTFPAMQGAVNYSLVIEAPSGLRRTFDSSEPQFNIALDRLNYESGIYTWYVIPYWNDSANPRRAQQLCVRRRGGTFEKPDTRPVTPTPTPSATPSA